jgi:hypothetical protein
VDTNQLLIELLGHLQKTDEARGVQEESLSDKNIVNKDSDDSTVESSKGRRKFGIIGEIFAEKFFQIQKKYTKDTALKTSVQKITPKAISEKNVQTKGGDSLKQLDKKSGLMNMLYTLFGSLLGREFLKGKLKILVKIVFNMFKRVIFPLVSKFFKSVVSIFGDNFMKSLKNMKRMGMIKIAKMFRGAGLMAKMLKFLKPVAGFLKKIPLIGNIISIGFAIYRFMNGDVVGGVIEVLSGLSLLLYPVAPPLALALSTGLDVLNAVLDAKQASPENAGKGKGAILWDMTKSLGSWIWKRAYSIPILGGIKRFMDAKTLFAAGDYKNGFHKIAMGMIALTGLAPIATGFEMLLGLFDNKNKEKDLKPKKSWMRSVKGWIIKRLEDLPWFMRKPLEWFGLLENNDATDPTITNKKPEAESTMGKMFDGIWNNLSSMAKIIASLVASSLGDMGDKIKNLFNMDGIMPKIEDLKNSVFSIFDNLLKVFSDFNNNLNQRYEVFGKNTIANMNNGQNIRPFDKNNTSIQSSNIPNIQSDKEKFVISVSNDNSAKNLNSLTTINNDQLKVLQDLRNISIETLKFMAKSNDKTVPMPVMASSNNRASNDIANGGVRHNLNPDRGHYNKSPYALA